MENLYGSMTFCFDPPVSLAPVSFSTDACLALLLIEGSLLIWSSLGVMSGACVIVSFYFTFTCWSSCDKIRARSGSSESSACLGGCFFAAVRAGFFAGRFGEITLILCWGLFCCGDNLHLGRCFFKIK